MVRKITLICRQVADLGNNKNQVVLNSQAGEQLVFIDDAPICPYMVGAQYDVTVEPHNKVN